MILYCFLSFFLSFCLFSEISSLEPDILYSWVQLSDSDSVSVRSIMKDNSSDCPMLIKGGASYNMNRRSLINELGFTSTVCEVTLNYKDIEGHSTIGYQDLFVEKKSQIKRILFIGDTGCRIPSNGIGGQDCKDENKYFFKKIVEASLSHNPDVVVHLGDYIYAKGECEEKELCGGLPYGDNMKNWESEFISPFYPLMEYRLSIFLRGNHEGCSHNNSGLGWSLFFKDGDDFSCEEREQLSVFDIGIAKFFSVDTAKYKSHKLKTAGKKKDGKIDFDSEKFMMEQIRKIKNYKNFHEYNNFLITHKPAIALFSYNSGDLDSGDLDFFINRMHFFGSEESYILPEKINAIISGHSHDVSIIALDGKFPTQIISGGGGALSHHFFPQNFNNFDKICKELNFNEKFYDNKIDFIRSIFGYGFIIMDYLGDSSWHLKAYNQDNKIIFDYLLEGKNVRLMSKEK